MKCNIYVSFSVFIFINTPHYAVFSFHFILCRKFLVYNEIMYVVLELMEFDVYNVDMYISCVFQYIVFNKSCSSWIIRKIRSLIIIWIDLDFVFCPSQCEEFLEAYLIQYITHPNGFLYIHKILFCDLLSS